MKGFPHWSTLAGLVALVALTGLNLNATPAIADDTDSGRYEDEDWSDSERHSDSYSRRDDGKRDQRYDGRDFRKHRSDWSSRDDDRDRRGFRDRDSRDRRWSKGDRRWKQGDRWNHRDGGVRCQCGRSLRGDHRRGSHGHRTRHADWNDQRGGRNRGGC